MAGQSYLSAVEHGRNGAGAEVLLAISREYRKSLECSTGIVCYSRAVWSGGCSVNCPEGADTASIGRFGPADRAVAVNLVRCQQKPRQGTPCLVRVPRSCIPPKVKTHAEPGEMD
jgi:hypothetical protein